MTMQSTASEPTVTATPDVPEETRAPIVFVSGDDQQSILQPAYRFRRADHLTACVTRLASSGGGSFRYKAFEAEGQHFQPRRNDDLSTTSLLFDGERGREGYRYSVLRRNNDGNMPDGAENVCLLVEGPRQAYRLNPSRRRRSGAYEKFASCLVDSYVTWGRAGAHTLGRPLFTEEPHTVFTGRSGRGAIYSVAPRFNDDLTVQGFDTRLVMVNFAMLDNTPRMGDVVRYETCHLLRHGSDANEMPQPFDLDPERFDELSRALAQRAFEGFKKHGARMPKALAAELNRYRDQDAKAKADRDKYDGSYRASIKALGWQSALETVKEPWQLEVVLSEKRDEEFDDSPNYQQTNASRTSKMLARHACTDARRAELQAMVSDFVYLRDSMWMYSRD